MVQHISTTISSRSEISHSGKTCLKREGFGLVPDKGNLTISFIIFGVAVFKKLRSKFNQNLPILTLIFSKLTPNCRKRNFRRSYTSEIKTVTMSVSQLTSTFRKNYLELSHRLLNSFYNTPQIHEIYSIPVKYDDQNLFH